MDQVDANTVSITRHKPQTHESVVLIARTAFQHPDNPTEQGYIRPIVIQGKLIINNNNNNNNSFRFALLIIWSEKQKHSVCG